MIYKHVDKFVIDPSSREEKIVDEKAEREVESRISLSSYNKLAKYYKVN